MNIQVKLTNALRRIRNAWHFYHAFKFSDLGGMRQHQYCVAHHLSGRYIVFQVQGLKWVSYLTL
ncbi:DUF3265 domain-containing protein [Vibrio cholerae]|nr:DUF3265 domain-containing protein [Vibrio cholerae]